MSSLAFNYIVNLLSRREYSEFELRNKMQEKNFSEEEIDDALSLCPAKNWQNDRRFTENYLHFRAQRGFGPNRIKQELHQLKGVQTEVIDEVFMESEIDWSKQALVVLNKKFPDYRAKQEPKSKQKIWRYMLSHGFYADDFADYVGSGDEYLD